MSASVLRRQRDLLLIALIFASVAIGEGVEVRDYGLLTSARWHGPARRCSVRCLLQSLSQGRHDAELARAESPTAGGNKRLAWTACRTSLATNDHWISAPGDGCFDLVTAVAIGPLSHLDEIAETLRVWSPLGTQRVTGAVWRPPMLDVRKNGVREHV